jgi:transcriptional regulator with GAF, ATPase, and Fis domain
MEAAHDSPLLRLLYDLGKAFAARLELDELIPFVIAKCRDALDAEGVSILLLDQERNELYFPYVSESDPEVARRLGGVVFPADRGVAGAVIRSGHGEKVDHPQSDSRHYSEVDRRTGVLTRSLLAAPLISDEERLGVIEAVNPRNREYFTDDDLDMLERLAESIAVAIQNARRFGQIKVAEKRLQGQVGALRRELSRHDRFAEIIGVSPAMTEIFPLIESAAASSITVLIEGDTGTGKELVARAIHRTSARADGPFLAVNCAAMPEALLESELFGHRRGAFTGATDDQLGLFRAAAGGTILLDEIGDMPAAMQAKLLRVLQEGEVTAVGDTRPRKVDVRVLSSTNRDLKAAVKARAFREDLYYRLAAFPIHLPPLRERRDDIAVLASRFLEAAAARHHKRISGLDPEALELLTSSNWPGNVRELQNEVERAVALARDGDSIKVGSLSPALRAVTPQTPATAENFESRGAEPMAPAASPLREARASFEAHHIAEVLARYQGNISHAAKALEISRVALQKKMKEYRLR